MTSITKTQKVRVKMYGSWHEWASVKEAILELLDYCTSCEGAERDRYMDALMAIKSGQRIINTDYI